MTTKALSRCCTAKARVNVRDGGYFCDACGKDCGTKQEASGFGAKASTLSNGQVYAALALQCCIHVVVCSAFLGSRSTGKKAKG